MTGIEIIWTREQAPSKELVDLALSKGYRLNHLPLIKRSALPLPQNIDSLVRQSDWLMVTSPASISYLDTILSIKTLAIASVGSKTSRVLREKGHVVSFEPHLANRRSLLQEWLLLQTSPQTVLFPHSSRTSMEGLELLTREGHHLLSFSLYETLFNPHSQSQIREYGSKPQAIWTFASPSAWMAFYEIYKQFLFSVSIAAIGETTARAIQESGCRVNYLASQVSGEAMIDSIITKGIENDI